MQDACGLFAVALGTRATKRGKRRPPKASQLVCLHSAKSAHDEIGPPASSCQAKSKSAAVRMDPPQKPRSWLERELVMIQLGRFRLATAVEHDGFQQRYSRLVTGHAAVRDTCNGVAQHGCRRAVCLEDTAELLISPHHSQPRAGKDCRRGMPCHAMRSPTASWQDSFDETTEAAALTCLSADSTLFLDPFAGLCPPRCSSTCTSASPTPTPSLDFPTMYATLPDPARRSATCSCRIRPPLLLNPSSSDFRTPPCRARLVRAVRACFLVA